MAFAQPLTVPPAVAAAFDAVAGLDDALGTGLGRLGPDQQAKLDEFAAVFAGSPLGDAVRAAVDGLGRGEYHESKLVPLALARAALQGAQYDALLAAVRTSLGRPPADPADPLPPNPVPADAGPLGVRLEAARAWLAELALTGFRQLTLENLAPFRETLGQLRADPRLTRPAAVLGGLADELVGCLPIKEMEAVPLYRWADLWARGMIAAARDPGAPAGDPQDGDLLPLAVRARRHGTFLAAEVWGVWSAGGADRLVRVPLAVHKVDVLEHPQVWQKLDPRYHDLLKAVADGARLSAAGMTPTATGHLLWTGSAEAGKPFDPAEQMRRFRPGADSLPALPAVPAADRHPLQLAEPVCLTPDAQPYDPAAVAFPGGVSLSLAHPANAWHDFGKKAALTGGEDLFGLLTFDAGWHLELLGVAAGKKARRAGADAHAGTARGKKSVLAALEFKAGKLLRAKA